MSGLEALGVACNIMQVIDTAFKTVALCKDIYDGKSPDGSLSENAAALNIVSLQIQDLCQTWQQHGQDEHDLSLLARKCSVAARELNEEVAHITSHQKKGDWIATIRTAAKTNWRKRRLDRISQSLQSWQRTMETHLMRRICTQNTALEIEQSRRFDKLDQSLRNFVSKLSSGETALAALVDQESITTRAQISRQITYTEEKILQHSTSTMSSTRAAITGHVSEKLDDAVDKLVQGSRQLHLASTSETSRERFVKSFKFTEMNERMNQVSEACKGTFSWIFKGAKLSNDETSRHRMPYKKGFPTIGKQRTFGGRHHLKALHNIETSSGSVSDESESVNWALSEDEESSENDPVFPVLPRTPRQELWDNFADWLRSESNIYWVSGKPGSGKSTLVRYLIDASETQRALNVWRPDVAILSHFFWKPGSHLQKSMKGLYCSLLYQLFSACQEITASTLRNNPSFGAKDSDADWSPAELKRLLQLTLEKYPRALCVFLDGLDEVVRDETNALLETIEGLQRMPDIKICISSRPESRFQVRFQQHQQLRLQDLTYNDMCIFASKQLKPLICVSENIDHDAGYKILKDLAKKAEGVFIWLVLAVQSLTRGVQNGDSPDMLLARLKVLPSDLISLYSEMWDRLGDDKQLYQQRASEYLNLVLLLMQMPRGDSGPNHRLFNVMAATDFKLQNSAFEEDLTIKDAEILQKCQETEQAIRLYCVGLLDVHDEDTGNGAMVWKTSLRFSDKPEDVKLRSGRRWISFVHRSAYDFVVDTAEGRQLCQNKTTTVGQTLLQLARGLLVSVKSSIHWHQPDTFLNVVRLLGQVKEAELQPRVWNIFRKCQQWYDARLMYGPPNYADPDDQLERLSLPWLNRPLFLSFSSDPCFVKYALAQIRRHEHATKLATRVLFEIFRVGQHDPLLLLGYVNELLAAGADPNRKRARCISGKSILELKTVTETFLLSILPDTRHGYVNWYMLDHFPSLTALLRNTPDLDSTLLMCFHGTLQGGLYMENDIYRHRERYHDDNSKDGKLLTYEVTYVARPNFHYLLALSASLKLRSGIAGKLRQIFSATLQNVTKGNNWTFEQRPQILYVIVRSPGDPVSWASGRIWQPSLSRSRQISKILTAKRIASLLSAHHCPDDISAEKRAVQNLARRVISDVTCGEDYEEVQGPLWDRLVERGHPLVPIEQIPQYLDTSWEEHDS